MSRQLLLLLYLISLSTLLTSSSNELSSSEENARMILKPLTVGDFGFFELNNMRRKLGGSFQLCAPCTCCGGSKGLCLLSPCCYAINCNIPNRPFGFCSFSPKACDCTSCSV